VYALQLAAGARQFIMPSNQVGGETKRRGIIISGSLNSHGLPHMRKCCSSTHLQWWRQEPVGRGRWRGLQGMDGWRGSVCVLIISFIIEQAVCPWISVCACMHCMPPHQVGGKQSGGASSPASSSVVHWIAAAHAQTLQWHSPAAAAGAAGAGGAREVEGPAGHGGGGVVCGCTITVIMAQAVCPGFVCIHCSLLQVRGSSSCHPTK